MDYCLPGRDFTLLGILLRRKGNLLISTEGYVTCDQGHLMSDGRKFCGIFKC
jgi:hypothetical protein